MRIFSYNIHKGIGGRDRRYRFDRILEVIDDANPDIICLQEVDRNVGRSRHDNQPDLLAEHTRFANRIFQFNVHVGTGGYGNLLLSRWPFLSHHHVSLTRLRKKPRGAQLAVIQTPAGSLHVVNWHLGLTDRERHWQARRLLEHHLFRESNGLPTLIIGDTNDWRNTLGAGPFEVHGFHAATAPPSRFRSFPAWLPTLSLDKAFVRGTVVVRKAFVVRGHPTRDASDHLPLIVDFDLADTAHFDT